MKLGQILSNFLVQAKRLMETRLKVLLFEFFDLLHEFIILFRIALGVV